MRPSRASTIILFAAVGLTALGQNPPAKEPQSSETKGLPPRVSPSDYQAHAKSGDVTIAAEFTGHAVPVEGAPLSSEDFVVVEAAFFGPPDARLKLSPDDFSLRINSKKNTLSSQPFELVFKSLKDPEWLPPDAGEDKKSKSSFGSGGGGGKGMESGPPPPVHVPIELRRAMELKVRRGSFPSGERALPQAGLLFFSYHGKEKGITSLELIYDGPAGKATVNLQP